MVCSLSKEACSENLSEVVDVIRNERVTESGDKPALLPIQANLIDVWGISEHDAMSQCANGDMILSLFCALKTEITVTRNTGVSGY